MRDFKPDIVQVHNTVPLISPSIYRAAVKGGAPVVQLLHNFRFICPAATLYRDGHICRDCVGKLIPYPAILHNCYRESKVQSAVMTATLAFNRIIRNYQNNIEVYIAQSEAARQEFIGGGMPADKIFVKPNFIRADIERGDHQGGYALFAGRLVDYKGVECLINAWRLLDSPIPLKIVGKGPLESMLQQNLPDGVEALGHIPREDLFKLMQNASVLIYPSEWYESFGMSVIEAFATGLPVIASKIGGPAETVVEGENGWRFIPRDANDLARVVQEAWSHPEELRRRGDIARRHYLEKYTPERNHEILMEIYQTAIERFKSRQKV
jgi:glycosyltransferase involved in cell wall biosynthesis